MVVEETQFASDYDNRTTEAVRSALIEIGQTLGSFEGRFAVIGGAVPWLLLAEAEMPHIGTQDIDLSLDAEALGDSEYVNLVEALFAQGYQQRAGLRRFQLVRTVPSRDAGPDIDVIVDFLVPRDAQIEKNDPPIVTEFAVQRAHGAELALQYSELILLEGEMPDGGKNSVRIAVASIPALLAMKGYAIDGRNKLKDAYAIYYCVRNFPGGLAALVEATTLLLTNETARQGYELIAAKFRELDDFGPTSVRHFVEGSDALADRTADQWQQDAFGQVDVWLKSLGLR